MDSGKHGNSDTFTEENGHESSSSSPEKSKDDNTTGASRRRSYECTFCKRGFTNAQALGGHMNIHRKDKAKAKSEKNATKSKQNDNLTSIPYSSTDHFQGQYYHSSSPSFEADQMMNYQAYFPPPNPSYQQGYICHYPNHFGGYEESLGTNLSLQIGPSAAENSKGMERDDKEDWLEHEVDLELRLGHHP